MRNVAVRFSASVRSNRRELELPDRDVLAGVDARDGGTDAERADRLARGREEAVDVGLDGQVGLHGRRPAELVGQCPGRVSSPRW